MSFPTKKVRKFFPKKGPERKAFMFLSNINNIAADKRVAVYKKVLKSKKGIERETLVHARKTLASRKQIFSTFDHLVKTYRSVEPGFDGIIVFGGVVKKYTPPTDLDFIFVGTLSDAHKRAFCEELTKHTGVPANPFPVELDIRANPRAFDKLVSIPYLYSHREWAVQNFIGPLATKRALLKGFRSALKKVAVSKRTAVGA